MATAIDLLNIHAINRDYGIERDIDESENGDFSQFSNPLLALKCRSHLQILNANVSVRVYKIFKLPYLFCFPQFDCLTFGLTSWILL